MTLNTGFTISWSSQSQILELGLEVVVFIRSLLTTSKGCSNVCRSWGTHKVSEVDLWGEFEIYVLITPDLTAQLRKSHMKMTFRYFAFVHCLYKKGPLWRAWVTTYLCVGSWDSSTEMLMCAIPAAISMCSKIRGAHHCLVPCNKDSRKGCAEDHTFRPVIINFHFQTLWHLAGRCMAAEEELWLGAEMPWKFTQALMTVFF